VRRIGVVNVIHDIGRGFGGAEIIAFEIARRLDRARFRSFVCVTHSPPQHLREQAEATFGELRASGVTVLALDRRSWRDVRPWRELYSLMRRERIEIVHTHMLRASAPGTVLARLSGVPVVIAHEQTWSFEGRWLRRFVDRCVIAALSNRFVAVSELDRSRMIERERIPSAKVVVVNNAVPELPPLRGNDVRAELGVHPDAPLVGALARLEPQKGLEVLVAAARLLRDDIPELRVAVFGEGSERERLRRMIASESLDDTVLLPGPRHDVRDVLAALDVAVLSSHFEGWPLALMEYMAAECAIVATAVGGVPDLIDDGVHGLLSPPGDPHAFAAAVRRLLDDRPLAHRLGAAARRRQETDFGVDAMVQRIERLYVAELIGAERRAGREAP
jgi:glycosyltransferase involved in cell wall biosynthesis